MDVKTAGRTLEIFEAFAREQAPLSLTDLARQLGSPLSSCLYLVRTLERLGYLYPVGGRRTLYPTRKLFEVAAAIAMGEPWIERIEPLLKKLRDESRETVILGKRQGAKVVYLAVYEGPETIRYVAHAGAASLGKLLAKLPLEPVTPATIVDRELLLADLGRAAELGYAVTRGENVPDVMALAQRLDVDQDVYGVALAGPLNRMTAQLEVQRDRLRKACEEISRR
jgi:DNA-binding IclR family transcriptional regulator